MTSVYSDNIRARSEDVQLRVRWNGEVATPSTLANQGTNDAAAAPPAATFLRLRRMNDASDPVYTAAVRALFSEYFHGLGIDMAFQDVSSELNNLPGSKYTEKAGGFLYLLEAVTGDGCGDAKRAVVEGEAAPGVTLAGCIALRDLGGGISEAKRLYVRPAWRGRDLGRLLLVQIVDVARQAGYDSIRLDTLARFQAANAVYAKMGFQRIDPYNYNPEADVLYFELRGLQSPERDFTKGRERYYSETPNAQPTPSPTSSPAPCAGPIQPAPSN